ncbi:hypothetical protein D3C85_1416380 [compost metagenome]
MIYQVILRNSRTLISPISGYIWISGGIGKHCSLIDQVTFLRNQGCIFGITMMDWKLISLAGCIFPIPPPIFRPCITEVMVTPHIRTFPPYP